MKVKVEKATGVLEELLANIDEKELAKIRKRMMLAAKIEEAMKRCGYNKTQFAHLMKKSPTVISEWLSGDRNFTTDTLTDIEEALGVRLIDTTLMTVINTGAGISQRASKNTATISLNREWNPYVNHDGGNGVYNCA